MKWFLCVTGTFVLCALLSLSYSGSAQALKIGIKGIDGDDVDLLIGHFGRLTTALEKFLIDDNSILEQRIDQAFTAFNKTLQCATDQLVNKGVNRVETALPDFKSFRSDESKACEGETLRPYGQGGLWNKLRYERCVLKVLITKKSVDTEAVSAGYSGIKEIANAAYCQYAAPATKAPNTPAPTQSAEYERAKGYFAEAGILLNAYADVAKIDGCSRTSPTALHTCALKYATAMDAQLGTYRAIDLRVVNRKELQSLAKRLPSPTVEKRWFGADEIVLPVVSLEKYENLISGYRRAVELASASKEGRQLKYQKTITPHVKKILDTEKRLAAPLNQLAKQYIQCATRHRGICFGLKWEGLTSVVHAFERATRECQGILGSDELADLATAKDQGVCTKTAKVVDARIKAIESDFQRRNQKQIEAAMNVEAMVGAPK